MFVSKVVTQMIVRITHLLIYWSPLNLFWTG